jgi:hypothetical protein
MCLHSIHLSSSQQLEDYRMHKALTMPTLTIIGVRYYIDGVAP